MTNTPLAEWKAEAGGRKQPYYIHLPDAAGGGGAAAPAASPAKGPRGAPDDRVVLAVAGLWDAAKGERARSFGLPWDLRPLGRDTRGSVARGRRGEQSGVLPAAAAAPRRRAGRVDADGHHGDVRRLRAAHVAPRPHARHPRHAGKGAQAHRAPFVPRVRSIARVQAHAVRQRAPHPALAKTRASPSTAPQVEAWLGAPLPPNWSFRIDPHAAPTAPAPTAPAQSAVEGTAPPSSSAPPPATATLPAIAASAAAAAAAPAPKPEPDIKRESHPEEEEGPQGTGSSPPPPAPSSSQGHDATSPATSPGGAKRQLSADVLTLISKVRGSML